MGKKAFAEWLGSGAPAPEGNSKKRRARVDKPKWEKLSDKGKSSLVRGMIASQDIKDEFNALVKQLNKEGGDQKPAAKNTCANVTVIPVIRVLNVAAGGPPVLPVNLDGLLPHINCEVGGCHEDTNVTTLVTPVDSGAGCTIGWQTYFELVFLNNPENLVKIYNCINGEYSPITMHGVADAEAGAATTDLPVAFEIRTPYRMRDGSRLHMMVACGPDVSVNFCMGNGWLTIIGAVLDYQTGELRVPMEEDLHAFLLTYRHPVKNVPSDTLAKSPHQVAHSALPHIEGLLRCMVVYTSKSPRLADVQAMVTQLCSTASTGIPLFIKDVSQEPWANVRRGGDFGSFCHLGQPFSMPDNGRVLRENERVKINTAHQVSGDMPFPPFWARISVTLSLVLVTGHRLLIPEQPQPLRNLMCVAAMINRLCCPAN